jgi:hypothetical protein
MPRILPVLVPSLVVLTAVFCAPTVRAAVPASPAQQDAGDPEPVLYDDTMLRNIEIVFEDADWRRQLEQMDESNPYDLPASLTVDGYALEQVGVRHKGNTSQRVSGPKKPFNVKTHAFVDGQDLWGFDVINLNNGASDPSMLREAVGYRILRDYMPVPQTSYAKVSVQGDFLGVYLMVEQVNSEMVDAWFPSDDGIIIKGDPAEGARLNGSALQWVGESLSGYESSYEVKTEGSEAAGYEHLRELARALDAPPTLGGLPDSGFAEGIRGVLDVEAALWYLAGSNLIQNGDSYYAGHNYYLYETANEPRFHVISWDLNMSFGVFPISGLGRPPRPGEKPDLVRQSPFTGEDSRNLPLVRRLLSEPGLRADFAAHYRTLRDEAFEPARVEQIALSYQDLIRDSVREEPEPIFTFAQFEHNLRSDVTISSRRPGGPDRVSPGLLTLAALRYRYMLDHVDLQTPDTRLTEHILEPAEPTAADRVAVTAMFGGADGVASAELRYRVDGGAEHVIGMVKGDASMWRAELPAHREGRDVSYVFRVGVEDGRAEFFPKATLTGPFVYRVAGVDLPSQEPGDLVINELMAANDATIADEAGEFDDWLELYNRGTSPVDLAGYFLSDDPADPWAFPLPEDQLGPGEHLLVWCDNDEKQGEYHAPFALSRDGESVVLSTADATLDRVDFGEQIVDVSYARAADGDEPWVLCDTPSPGAANSCGPMAPTPTSPPDMATPTPSATLPATPIATPTATPTATTATPSAPGSATPPTPSWEIHLPFAAKD